MRIQLSHLLRRVNGRMPVGAPDTEIDGAFVDSREVVPGALFVGLRGERTDGGHHALDALRAGAAAAVVRESSWTWIEGDAQALRKPVIVADDPLVVLQEAGRMAMEVSEASVIGITGATGKTTTKDILLAMLRSAGVRAEGTLGNRNTEIGVPLTLLGLSADADVAVVEMGMRGAGQIAELAALAPPTVGCITSIGPVHLDLLGTVEAVAAAKAELIQALGPGGTAVVPEDEPLLEPYVAALPDGVKVLRFGAEPDAPLDLGLGPGWLRENAAAALACCRAVGHAPAPGASVPVVLSSLRGQEQSLAGGGVLIEDCYNANPIAMRAALEDLARRPGRRVAVLADMMELGADEARYHREVGEAAAALGVDLLIAVGERAAGYAAGAGQSVHLATVDEAIEAVPGMLAPGDAVLLKGSRSMALERVGEAIRTRESDCPDS